MRNGKLNLLFTVLLVTALALFFNFENYALLQSSNTKTAESPASQLQNIHSERSDKQSDCWSDNEQDLLPAIEPLIVSKNRLLVPKCDTLFMFDENKQIVWKQSIGAPLTTAPIIDSQQTTIYALGYDLKWVALDAKTGALKWNNGGNGRAVYSQLKAYKDDTYLIVVNMAGYDGKYSRCVEESALNRGSECYRTEPDKLYLCRGKEILWKKEFPADAELKVWGDKILAVSSVKEKVEITEIKSDK